MSSIDSNRSASTSSVMGQVEGLQKTQAPKEKVTISVILPEEMSSGHMNQRLIQAIGFYAREQRREGHDSGVLLTVNDAQGQIHDISANDIRPSVKISHSQFLGDVFDPSYRFLMEAIDVLNEGESYNLSKYREEIKQKQKPFKSREFQNYKKDLETHLSGCLLDQVIGLLGVEDTVFPDDQMLSESLKILTRFHHPFYFATVLLTTLCKLMYDMQSKPGINNHSDFSKIFEVLHYVISQVNVQGFRHNQAFKLLAMVTYKQLFTFTVRCCHVFPPKAFYVLQPEMAVDIMLRVFSGANSGQRASYRTIYLQSFAFEKTVNRLNLHPMIFDLLCGKPFSTDAIKTTVSQSCARFKAEKGALDNHEMYMLLQLLHVAVVRILRESPSAIPNIIDSYDAFDFKFLDRSAQLLKQYMMARYYQETKQTNKAIDKWYELINSPQKASVFDWLIRDLEQQGRYAESEKVCYQAARYYIRGGFVNRSEYFEYKASVARIQANFAMGSSEEEQMTVVEKLEGVLPKNMHAGDLAKKEEKKSDGSTRSRRSGKKQRSKKANNGTAVEGHDQQLMKPSVQTPFANDQAQVAEPSKQKKREKTKPVLIQAADIESTNIETMSVQTSATKRKKGKVSPVETPGQQDPWSVYKQLNRGIDEFNELPTNTRRQQLDKLVSSAMAQCPKHSWVAHSAGWAYFQLGQHDKALQVLFGGLRAVLHRHGLKGNHLNVQAGAETLLATIKQLSLASNQPDSLDVAAYLSSMAHVYDAMKPNSGTGLYAEANRLNCWRMAKKRAMEARVADAKIEVLAPENFLRRKEGVNPARTPE